MIDSTKRARILERTRHAVEGDDDPRSPVEVSADVLAPLRRATAVSGICLLVLAALAGRFLDPFFGPEVLAGVPGLMHIALAALARPSWRRVMSILACGVSVLLLFATGGSVVKFELVFVEGRGGVLYGLFCFAIAALHLAVAAPVWRRLHAEVARAEARAAARDEL